MISVVGTVRNRAKDVERWLRSLAPHDLEVILVDYGSTDGLDGVLAKSPCPVRVIHLDVFPVDGFPEAYLKNTGIREATRPIVACTNVDVSYSPDFWASVARCSNQGVLVQAVRKNAPRGVVVNPDASCTQPKDGPPWSVTVDLHSIHFGPGTPIVAGGDMQAMYAEDWAIFRGYDERLYGWGGVDSDLMVRALLFGYSLVVLGHKFATYMHTWHEFDKDQQIEDAKRNHKIIMDSINCGTVARNPETWGGRS